MAFGRCATVVLIGLCAAGRASAQTYLVFGAGEKKCSDLTLAKNAKGSDPAVTYGVIVGWIDGYVTGGGAAEASQSLVWDTIVRGTDQTPTGVIAARQEYCRQASEGHDPICQVWNQSNVGMAVYPIMRDMSLKERLAWLDTECAAHPTEPIKDAASHLFIKLRILPTRTSSEPNSAPTLVGVQQYHTSLAGTTVLLTQTTSIMRLELFGGLQTAVDLKVDGADWIGRTEASANCSGAALWRLHQVEQTLLLDQSCITGGINDGRGLTLVLTKEK